MSTEIDNRIVSMEFDNSRFEKNVRQSMQTIADLNESLKFEDASKGFKEIQKESEKVDFDRMKKSIEPLKLEFSALEVAAVTAISNITNKLTNEVTKWGKMLTIEMPQIGYSKYDQQVTAMQTLVNQTGLSVEELEKDLSRLQRFSDETSYSFDEMMTALQTMVSSGGDLDKGISLMMGLANATAYAGQNAQSFVHAARNLTQSYAMGYLNLMDWKSLELAKVNSKALIQTLIDAGIELGTINKGEVTLSNFRDSLSDKWADTRVMELAFGRFAEMSEAALDLMEQGIEGIDTYDDALKALSNDYDGVYYKAAKAAYEAKTFSELVDYTKDALGSQWATTFKFIIGNYKEAASLWTGLSNTLYELLIKPREETNDILREWKELGGRTSLIRAFAAVLTNIMNITTAIKDGFREIFPRKTGKELAEITEKFANFNEKLVLSEKALNYLKIGVSGVSSIIKAVLDVIKGVLKAIFPVELHIGSITEGIGLIIAIIGTLLRKLAELISSSNILSGIVYVISKASNVLVGAISLIVSGVIALVNAIKNISITAFSGTLSVIKTVLSVIAGVIFSIVSGVKTLAKNVSNFFLILKRNGFFSKIGNGFLTVINAIGDGIMIMVNGIKLAVIAIASFIQKIKDMSWADKFKAIGDVFVKIKDTIANFFKQTKLGDLFGENNEKGQTFIETLKNIKDKILEFTGPLTASKLIAGALLLSLIGISTSLSKLLTNTSTLISNASGTLKVVKNIITKTYAKNAGILNVAWAVAILAGSLKVLSTVPYEDLVHVTLALSGLLTLVFIFNQFSTTKLTKTTDIIKNKFVDALLAFAGIGVGILAFAGAMKLISTIPQAEIKRTLLIISGMSLVVGAISLLVGWMSSWEKDVKGIKQKTAFNAIKFALLMASVSSALLSMSKAVVNLSAIDPQLMTDTVLKGVLPMLAAMGLLAAGLGQVRIGSFLGLLGILLTVKMVMPIITDLIKSIGELPDSVLTSAITAFGDRIIAFAGIMLAILAVLAFKGDSLNKGTKGLNRFIFATGLLVALSAYITKVIKDWNLTTKDFLPVFATIGLAVTGMIGIILAIAAVQKRTREGANSVNFSKIGSMFVKMGVGIGLILTSITLMAGLYDALEVKPETMNKMVHSMGVLMITAFGLFAIVIGVAGKFSEKNSNVVKIIRNMTTSLLLIVGGMLALYVLADDKERLQSVTTAIIGVGIAISAILVALGYVIKHSEKITAIRSQISKIAKGIGNLLTFVGIAGLIMSIAHSVIAVMSATDDSKKLLKVSAILVGTVTALLAVITVVNWFMSKILSSGEGKISKIVNMSVALIGAIGIIAHVGKTLVELIGTGATVDQMLKAAGSVGIIVGAIGALMILLSTASRIVAGSANAGIGFFAYLISIAGTIGIIMAIGNSLSKIKDLDWDSLGAGLIKASAAFAILGGVIAVLSLIASSGMGLVAVAAVFGLVIALIVTIGKQLSNLTDSLNTYFQTIKGYSLESFAEISYEAVKLGGIIASNINDGLRNAIPEFENAANTIVEMFEQSMSSDKFVTIGNYIGEGVAAGIRQSLETIQKSSEDIANTVTGTIKYKLDINSPSRVTTALGMYTGVGFSTGLLATTGYAATSAQVISEATTGIMDKVEDKAAKAGANAGESWWQSFKTRLTSGGNPQNRYAAGEALLNTDVGSAIGNKVKETKAAKYLTSKGETWDAIKKAGRTAINWIEDPESAKETLNEFVNLDDILGSLTEEFPNLGDAINEVTEGMDGASEATSNFGEAVKSTFETLRDSFEISNPFDDFDFTVEDPETMLDNLSHQLLGLMEFSDDMAILAARGVNQNLLEYLGNQGPQAYKYVAGLADATDEQLAYMNNLWSQKLKLPSYAAEEVEASYKYAGEMAAQGFSSALDQYFGMIDARGYGQLTIDQVAEALRDYSPPVIKEAAAKGVGSGLAGAQEPINDDAKESGREAANVWAAEFEDVLSARLAEQSFTNSRDMRRFMYADITKIGKALMDNTTTWKAIASTDLGKEWASIYLKFLEIGDDAFKGLNGAFIKNESDFYNAMFQFAELLPKATKDALQIGSPSKVMNKLGVWSIEGLKNGISDMAPVVNKEAENITDGLTDTMSTFAQNVLTYLFGDTTSTMTITPVLDLSKVQNGAAGISSLFAAEQAIKATSVFDANKQAYAASANNPAYMDNLVRECSNRIIDAISSSQPNIMVNNYNEADSYGIFKACRTEVKKFTKANGYNPMIQTM